MRKLFAFLVLLLPLTAFAAVGGGGSGGGGSFTNLSLGTNRFAQIQLLTLSFWTNSGATAGTCISNLNTAFTNGMTALGTTGAIQVLNDGWYDIRASADLALNGGSGLPTLIVKTNGDSIAQGNARIDSFVTPATNLTYFHYAAAGIRWLPSNSIVLIAFLDTSATASGRASNAVLMVMAASSFVSTSGSSATSISTNANQFGANPVLTLKPGATQTNLNSKGLGTNHSDLYVEGTMTANSISNSGSYTGYGPFTNRNGPVYFDNGNVFLGLNGGSDLTVYGSITAVLGGIIVEGDDGVSIGNVTISDPGNNGVLNIDTPVGVAGSVTAASFIATNPSPSQIIMNDTNAVPIPWTLGTGPSNSAPVITLGGILHLAAATPLFINSSNQTQWFSVTNRISAAITIVFTNTMDGQQIRGRIIGEAAGGTDRVVTLTGQGRWVNMNDLSAAPANGTFTFTLTNGYAVELSDAIDRLNGTNTHAVVVTPHKF